MTQIRKSCSSIKKLLETSGNSEEGDQSTRPEKVTTHTQNRLTGSKDSQQCQVWGKQTNKTDCASWSVGATSVLIEAR